MGTSQRTAQHAALEPRLPRRALLAAAGGVTIAAATGCHGVGALGTPPKPAADAEILRTAIATELLTIRRYRAALAGTGSGHHGLPAVLRALLGEHQQHLEQLRSRLVIPAGAKLRGRRPRPAEAPGGPAASASPLAPLIAAERASSAFLLSRVTAVPASLAQLFASIAASEATHVPVLQAAGGTG
jgi:hypothetical protein